VELADDGRVVVILQVQAQQAVLPIVQHLEVLDVVVVAENSGDRDFSFDTACRPGGGPPYRRCAPGSAIGDGINDAHLVSFTS